MASTVYAEERGQELKTYRSLDMLKMLAEVLSRDCMVVAWKCLVKGFMNLVTHYYTLELYCVAVTLRIPHY